MNTTEGMMMSKTTTRTEEAVRSLLAELVHDPGELEQEDGSYRVAWTTEYDASGELVDDPVAALNQKLPAGWSAAWTGNGNGDTEDFLVAPDDEDEEVRS